MILFADEFVEHLRHRIGLRHHFQLPQDFAHHHAVFIRRRPLVYLVAQHVALDVISRFAINRNSREGQKGIGPHHLRHSLFFLKHDHHRSRRHDGFDQHIGELKQIGDNAILTFLDAAFFRADPRHHLQFGTRHRRRIFARAHGTSDKLKGEHSGTQHPEQRAQ